MGTVTPKLAEKFNLKEPKGILVTEVFKGSLAEKAGVKQDDVILTFDGKHINETSELPHLLASMPIGKRISVEILRDGKSSTLELTLVESQD
ncbi:MAG: PDZ domain-containing protein [Deltaproteobacteria bacterium]|nr:PDZ domain-containing protein [Deltaproteobacteria bacterium]